MKIDIVTCYESNEERVTFIMEICKSRGYDVKAITSNFSHFRKEKRNNVPDNYVAIETKPYPNNLSIKRLLSHKQFAEDAFKEIKKDNPDLIWVVAPALSLIKEANSYKKENPNVKIIVDIIDMWPESLPLGKIKNTLPFNIWRNIRINNINCADELVSECDLYHNILSNEYKGKITTIHWARDAKANKYELDLPKDKLSLCYIGSINNIIGIDIMKKLIKSINKDVVLHIIGDGESKDEMLNTLKEVCEVVYYGTVYGEKKQEIFKKCHAGLNIYKEGLYIGLTVKCMDYFRYGLPIINNIKGDTWSFVEKDKVGINVDENSVINASSLIDMRNSNQNIIDLYNSNFTREIFDKKCLEVIDRVMSK